mmetsp:Transcript_71211/g.131291  ORF Transcript_71211/g.131291 Transcript_71211/m.131291 type:complete len:326 (+) Transcript_71211:43-1020(+)
MVLGRVPGQRITWFACGAVFGVVLAIRFLISHMELVGREEDVLNCPRNSRSCSAVATMHALREVQSHPRVVVSFTTFPLGMRMAGVADMLRSLAKQTLQPDQVILNFPTHIARLSIGPLAIPREVEEWKQMYRWLKVHQTKDYGPATKLLGALEVEKNPDTIIIIVDDDTYYHRDTVLAHVSAMVSSPIDIASCFVCEGVHLDWYGRSQWSYTRAEGKCRGFASGYASYAVRPRYFDKLVWDHSSAPKGCWMHDDVWISGSMLKATGVRPHVLKPGFHAVAGEFIVKIGARQNESIFVANAAALKTGDDPQGTCVAHFPFTVDVG